MQKITFLGAKEGLQPPYGVAVRPLPRGPLGHRIALILLPKNHKYAKKKISVGFYPLWTPFDMDFLRNKNMQQIGTDTGHWINMLVPKVVKKVAKST